MADPHRNEAETLRHEAREALAAEDFDTAFARADAWRTVDSLNPEAHTLTGICLSQLARHDEALAAFRAALQLRPDDLGALYNLAVFYAQRGDFDQASHYAKRSLGVDPEHTPTHDLLEWIRENHRPALAEIGDDPPQSSAPRRESLPEITPADAPYDPAAQRWPRDEEAFLPGSSPGDLPTGKQRSGGSWRLAGWGIAVLAFACMATLMSHSIQMAQANLATMEPGASFNEAFTQAMRLAQEANTPDWVQMVSLLAMVLSLLSFAYIWRDVARRRGKYGWVVAAGLAQICCSCSIAAWLLLPLYLAMNKE